MTQAIRVTLSCIVVLAPAFGGVGCGGADHGSPTTAHEEAPRDGARPRTEHGTTLTLAKDAGRLYHGWVLSEVKECSVGREVLLFEQRRGRDRELGATRSGVAPVGIDAVGEFPEKDWAVVPPRWIELRRGARIYAVAPRKRRSGYACRADRSKVLLHQITID